MSRFIYIYELPYATRTKLCELLNLNSKWRKLAGDYMKLEDETIKKLEKGDNPADELLTLWGNFNHEILELYILLYQMEDYRLMVFLQPFVEDQYHALMYLRKDKSTETSTEVTRVKTSTKATKHRNDTSSKSCEPTSKHSKPLFSSSLPQIPFDEVVSATDNWNQDNFLGKGGFAFVFKGMWKNTEVAVKKLHRKNSSSSAKLYEQQLEQMFREIKLLNSLQHENVLSLYAYSMDGVEPCLVYQYMKNGSLSDRLHLAGGSKPLDWPQRENIAKGIARGLQYLHTARPRPLIHGDIKSANILLTKHFDPKIGDFGLARKGSAHASVKVNKIQGTRSYLPKDYLYTKALSTKIDTYSYGIVLLELATAIAAYNKVKLKGESLKNYVDSFGDNLEDICKLKDKKAGETGRDIFMFLILYGKWCSQEYKEQRPEMTTVYEAMAK
ncbi:serine/threonine-protein kinase pelle-like [Copidosoma floridanum]|uniref:serine/threonine-protein kinase pelle-like n=1 Tax=Copidosoma floridanum TaxID=29053 RepID=UPI0006C98EB0|nr:serine/threonine-protein kinase pelle-like [Copidosoma floridanum]